MNVELNGIQYSLEVVIRTDNTQENNIKFIWMLNDMDNIYYNNGVINGVNGADEYEYVCSVLGLTKV